MKPSLIVDFDSTFIRDETLDEIAKLLLSSKKISSEDMISSNISITGDLIIKGISNKVVINTNVDFNKNISRGQLIVDRTKWDIKYASGNYFKDLGDKAILDEIEFDISLESVK